MSTVFPVSRRALEQRIRRALARNSMVLHRCSPSSRAYRDLGEYYIVDDRRHLVELDCGLEELGRELGVLRGYEGLADE